MLEEMVHALHLLDVMAAVAEPLLKCCKVLRAVYLRVLRAIECEHRALYLRQKRRRVERQKMAQVGRVALLQRLSEHRLHLRRHVGIANLFYGLTLSQSVERLGDRLAVGLHNVGRHSSLLQHESVLLQKGLSARRRHTGKRHDEVSLALGCEHQSDSATLAMSDDAHTGKVEALAQQL